MADDAAGFGQGSSDPALLRVPARFKCMPRTGLSPATARLPRRVPLSTLLPLRPPYNPGRASTPPVWAGPLSLAATRGVTVVFLSSAYLDVSVRRVGLRYNRMPRPRAAGFPIRASADPWLLAPPRGLSRPAAPFLAPGSLGIPRAPFLARSPPDHIGPRPSSLSRSCVSSISRCSRFVRRRRSRDRGVFHFRFLACFAFLVSLPSCQ